MAQEDREAWESLEAEFAAKAYMQELRRQHPELMEAERVIFAGAEGGEVIVLSYNDGVEGGKDGGALFVKGQAPRAVHGDLAEILLAEIRRILQ